MRTLFAVITVVSAIAATPLFAATQNHDMMNHDAMPMATMDHSSMNHGMMTSAPVYQGTGVVKAWNDSQVTLAHQPIPALNWPAMTMRFGLNGYQGNRFDVGQSVTFTFKQSASGYDLISVSAH